MSEIKPVKKLYVVDVMSTFRMRYVVEAKEEDHAWDEVVCNEHNTDFKEFSQVHVGTHIFSSREITEDEYFELFEKDNAYLSKWSAEQKLALINVIDYGEFSE
jgi:hypothetical protein